MDEHRAKFSGSHIALPEPLSLGDEIIFRGSGSVTSDTAKDMQDGTCIHIYTIRPILLELSASEGQLQRNITTDFTGDTSPSKRLRNVLYRYWEQQLSGKHPNFQAWYEDWIEHKINQVEEHLV